MTETEQEPPRFEAPTWEALAQALAYTPQTVRNWRAEYPSAPRDRYVVDWCAWIHFQGLGRSHYVNGKVGAVEIYEDLESILAHLRTAKATADASGWSERLDRHSVSLVASVQAMMDELDRIFEPQRSSGQAASRFGAG